MDRSELLQEVAGQILAAGGQPVTRVALDGIDAAGKTTLADELAPLLKARRRSVIRASIDGFHNPRAVRYARGSLSPEGYFCDSFNLSAVVGSLLAPLGPSGNGIFRSAVFDYRVDVPVHVEPQLAPPGAVLLFDGIFLARPELAPYWELFIFVQISVDTCLTRAWERNRDLSISEEAIRRRYQARYLPAQERYLADCRPFERADLIVHNDDPARPRLTIR